MEKTSKQPPVDRGKLMIALECCRDTECAACPYYGDCFSKCEMLARDSLAYISYLEERLEEAGRNG